MAEGFDERQILWIVYLFMIIFLLITVSIKIKDAADDTLFNEKFLAAETASLEDAVMSAPGDVEVKYELQGKLRGQFNFGFKGCDVFVSKNEEFLENGNNFFCSEDIFLSKEDAELENVNAIVFKKRENTLTIEKV